MEMENARLFIILMKIQQQFSQWTWNYDRKNERRRLRILLLRHFTHSLGSLGGIEESSPFSHVFWNKFWRLRSMRIILVLFGEMKSFSLSRRQSFIYFYYLFPLFTALQFQFQLDLCCTPAELGPRNGSQHFHYFSRKTSSFYSSTGGSSNNCALILAQN